MYLLLVFLSLIGSCCAGLFGRKLGFYGVTCLLITFFLFLFTFFMLILVTADNFIQMFVG